MNPVLLDWNQRYKLMIIYTHTHTQIDMCVYINIFPSSAH